MTSAPASRLDRAQEFCDLALMVAGAPKGTDCHSCHCLGLGFEDLPGYLQTWTINKLI